MAVTGIDLLFVIIGLILLFILVEGGHQYNTWREWNLNRRRERWCYRYEVQDSLTEEEYRAQLRKLLKPNLISSIHQVTRSFEKFNEVLRG